MILLNVGKTVGSLNKRVEHMGAMRLLPVRAADRLLRRVGWSLQLTFGGATGQAKHCHKNQTEYDTQSFIHLLFLFLCI